MPDDAADDKLTLDDIAAMIGHSQTRTLASWLALRRPEHNPVPEPDGHKIEDGHARPVWERSTIEAWVARRPGRGHRPKKAKD